LESLATVDRALDVLQHLHSEGRPLGVSEVGRALKLPKSTVHRVLSALARRGFVERDARGRCRPGMALVALGVGVLEREPVVLAARRVLEREAELLGETLFLAGARGGRLLVLDKQEGTGFLRAAPRVGAEVPLHATAVGKLYLAFDPDAVERLEPLERFTPRTRTDRAAIERELARVRARGFAENREEWIPGLFGAAAPVWSGERLVAALAVAGPASRVQGGERERFVTRIRAAADRVAARLAGAV
jgi:IclR family acetate operon transcriptional repressor